MKSKFWASIVALILTFAVVVFFWFCFKKPNAFSNEELMIFDTAALALFFSLRDDLLRKED